MAKKPAYFVAGLSQRERDILDQVGAGNSQVLWSKRRRALVVKLLDAGLIEPCGERAIGAVAVQDYQMPADVRIRWCEWCSKREVGPRGSYDPT